MSLVPACHALVHQCCLLPLLLLLVLEHLQVTLGQLCYPPGSVASYLLLLQHFLLVLLKDQALLLQAIHQTGCGRRPAVSLGCASGMRSEQAADSYVHGVMTSSAAFYVDHRA